MNINENERRIGLIERNKLKRSYLRLGGKVYRADIAFFEEGDYVLKESAEEIVQNGEKPLVLEAGTRLHLSEREVEIGGQTIVCDNVFDAVMVENGNNKT